MDIQKQIIDQRIRGIIKQQPTWFESDLLKNDETRKLSHAFLLLSVASYLDIDMSEAIDHITDGPNDQGVDALYIQNVEEATFTVVLIQAKYHHKHLDRAYTFPDNEVQKLVQVVKALFDPSKSLSYNERLAAKVEEMRALIMDGFIPKVYCVLTNNGGPWQAIGQEYIDQANLPKAQVTFEHFSHEDIMQRQQAAQAVNDTISLSGSAVVENFNYKRVIVGKVNVKVLSDLLAKHGDVLLERNIRKYLGVNRVNQSIKETLLDDTQKANFYFYNNGITILCNRFNYNALAEKDWQVQVEHLQIINGGQTSKTISEVVQAHPTADFSQVYVLLRLYEVPNTSEETEGLTTDITIATNSQTPVDLRDLKANDRVQRQLVTLVEALGYHYKPKKGGRTTASGIQSISSSLAAEAVLSTWRKFPHVAKYKKSELFGVYYDLIFESLNGAQLVLAVLIFRFAEQQRRDEALLKQHRHLAYSSYFTAMLMADQLLTDTSTALNRLNHQTFTTAKDYWANHKNNLFAQAMDRLDNALSKLYPQGINGLDPRTLAATFRRGDLLRFF